jgi:formylglycine-generating enzyme required for sulfatase activity
MMKRTWGMLAAVALCALLACAQLGGRQPTGGGAGGAKSQGPANRNITVDQSKPVGATPVPSIVQTDTENLGGGVTLEMVWIEGGTFTMGSTRSGKELARMFSIRDASYFDKEHPAHAVVLDGFWLGRYEVAQRQYEAVMGANPSAFKGPNRPVEIVSWDDAIAFCRKLSQMTGKSYTLPTEAQWEYACRAGGTTEYCIGDSMIGLDEYAWYSKNSGGQTHDVGQKKPNAWGLYDMHGNVWEWCLDWYGPYGRENVRNPTGLASGQYRVVRGGSWNGLPRNCRSANRIRAAPGYRFLNGGFRCVRTQK